MDEDSVHGGYQPSLAVTHGHFRVGKRILIVDVVTAEIERNEIKSWGKIRAPQIQDNPLATSTQQDLAGIFQAFPEECLG